MVSGGERGATRRLLLKLLMMLIRLGALEDDNDGTFKEQTRTDDDDQDVTTMIIARAQADWLVMMRSQEAEQGKENDGCLGRGNFSGGR